MARRAAAAAAIVVAVGILAAGDTQRSQTPTVVNYPDRPMATLGTQFSPPPESAIEEPDWPVIDAAPAWRVRLPEEIASEYDVEEVLPTEDGYLIRARERLLAVDRDGEAHWQREHVPGSSPLDFPRLDVAMGQDTVIVGHRHPTDERWPGRDVITALDPDTGEELWQEDGASFWSVVDGTIYLSICNGGQDGEIGDCELEARDVRSNQTRWRIPTYASVRVVVGRDPYLVLESFPTGSESRTITVVDTRSGRQLAAGFDGQQGASITPETLVREDGGDDNPADGCTTELTGFDLDSGEEVWRYGSRTPKEADGAYCAGLPESSFGGRYALTDRDRRPVVLDPSTGEVEWTAPEPGFGLAATRELALVVDEVTGAEPELVLYDQPSGRERWRTPLPPGDETPAAVLFSRTVLVYRNSGADLYGYDLATGDGWTYLDPDGPGERWLIGRRWVAVCDADACRGYDVR